MCGTGGIWINDFDQNERNKSCNKYWCGLEDNTGVGISEIGYESVAWIQSPQVRVHFCTAFNTAMRTLDALETGKFEPVEGLSDSQERLYSSLPLLNRLELNCFYM
jgi:hypothetical protein